MSISATPPPRAVELTFHTTRPARSLRPSSAASSTCAYRSGGRIDSNRSNDRRPMGTEVRADISGLLLPHPRRKQDRVARRTPVPTATGDVAPSSAVAGTRGWPVVRSPGAPDRPRDTDRSRPAGWGRVPSGPWEHARPAFPSLRSPAEPPPRARWHAGCFGEGGHDEPRHPDRTHPHVAIKGLAR